jgi:hypothetical protein
MEKQNLFGGNQIQCLPTFTLAFDYENMAASQTAVAASTGNEI